MAAALSPVLMLAIIGGPANAGGRRFALDYFELRLPEVLLAEPLETLNEKLPHLQSNI